MIDASDFNTDKIFYTMIDKEIYAVKILDMYVPVDEVDGVGGGNSIILGKNIHSVNFEIATKGVMKYNINDVGTKHWKEATDLLINLYNTIDDCICRVNKVFKFDDIKGQLNLTNLVLYLMEDICPNNAKWEYNYNNTFSLICWHWDGIKPVKHYFKSPSNDEDAWGNFKRTPLFNMVKNKWLVDKEYYNKCYPTYDACIKNEKNCIKVHLFNKEVNF